MSNPKVGSFFLTGYVPLVAIENIRSIPIRRGLLVRIIYNISL